MKTVAAALAAALVYTTALAQVEMPSAPAAPSLPSAPGAAAAPAAPDAAAAAAKARTEEEKTRAEAEKKAKKAEDDARDQAREREKQAEKERKASEERIEAQERATKAENERAKRAEAAAAAAPAGAAAAPAVHKTGDARADATQICLAEARSRAKSHGATDVHLRDVKDTDKMSSGRVDVRATVDIVSTSSKGKVSTSKKTMKCKTQHGAVTGFKFD